MVTRRAFLGAAGGGLLMGAGASGTQPASGARSGSGPRKKLAIVTTEWRYHSHAWHMAERFLVGYPIDGQLASAAVRRGRGLRRSEARRTT